MKLFLALTLVFAPLLGWAQSPSSAVIDLQVTVGFCDESPTGLCATDIKDMKTLSVKSVRGYQFHSSEQESQALKSDLQKNSAQTAIVNLKGQTLVIGKAYEYNNKLMVTEVYNVISYLR